MSSQGLLTSPSLVRWVLWVSLLYRRKLRALGGGSVPREVEGLYLQPGLQTPPGAHACSNLRSRRPEEDVKTPGGI